MSSLDLHPEDLLERARRGTLDAAGRRRLEAHLGACRVCRFEGLVAQDFRDESRPRDGDEALVERALAATLSAAETRPQRSRGRRLALQVAGAIALMALAAAAAVAVDRARRAPAARLEPAWRAGAVPRIERPEAAPTAPPASAPSGTASPAPSVAPPLDAAALFHRANEQRRSGSAQEAARLYRLLQERFPSSREASASRLALARLLLDRLGDPSGALRLFDEYLQGGGVLAEEALLGRALALARLGRTADERAAWKTFVARYPDSVHAERARRRLRELR